MRAWLVVFAALASLACACAQEDLPQPSEFAWETPATIVLPLPGLLAQGRMPVTQATADPARPDLGMIDLATGELLWSISLPSPPRAANSADGVLLLALGDRVAGVAVADGTVAWQQPVQGMLAASAGDLRPWSHAQVDPTRPGQGIGGALLVAGGTLYLGVGDTVYALQPTDGEVAWQRKVGFPLSAPLLAIGDSIVVATQGQGMGALSAADGAVRWSRDLPAVSGLFALDDELYCANRAGLYRLDPVEGTGIWSQPLPADPAQVLYGAADRLVVARSADVSVFGRTDGQPLRQFGAGNLEVVVAGDRLVYTPREVSGLVGVALPEVETVWEAPFEADALARLFVADDTVVAVCADLIAGYDLTTGEVLWEHRPLGGRVIDADNCLVGNSGVFFPLGDRVLGCDLRTGEWTLGSPGAVYFVYRICLGEDTLYVHSDKRGDETLRAIPLGAPNGG